MSQPTLKPRPDQLQLTNEVDEDAGIDTVLRTAIADPCYIYELGHLMDGWSRKQIEQALNRLLADGIIVSYGTKNRRLYASKRRIHPRLFGLPAVAIRLLQYMPLRGATTQQELDERGSEVGRTADLLAEHDLLLRLRGAPKMVCLTDAGEEARRNLGRGLALPPISNEQMDLNGGSIHRAVEVLVHGPLPVESITRLGARLDRLLAAEIVTEGYDGLIRLAECGSQILKGRRRVQRANQVTRSTTRRN